MNVDSQWVSPTIQPEISSREVHVWRTLLDQPETVVQNLSRILSPEELWRAARYVPDLNRQRFVIGRGWLKTVLAGYLRRPPETLDFCGGAHGKPELTTQMDHATLRFNLSHSNNLALLGVAVDRHIGVDVEQVRSVAEMDSIVTRHFSLTERYEFFSLPLGERQRAFFCAWTRKEAYLKAVGDGLSVPLDQVEVSLRPGEPPQLRSVFGRPLETTRWLLQDISPGQGFLGCISVEGSGWGLRCFQMDLT